MRQQTVARIAWQIFLLVGSLANGLAAQDVRRIPVFVENSVRIPGDTALKDFSVRLPSHVAFVTGCELALALHPSGPWFAEVCAISASVNGRNITSVPIAGTELTNQAIIQIRAEVPADVLMSDWNRVSLEFILRRPPEAGLLTSAAWELRREESYLALVSQPLPMFPELARFPETFVEERLFERSTPASPTNPIAVFLLPRERQDAHLRACAVLGARFGQLGFLSEGDCRLALLDDWEKETVGRNTVAVALPKEIGSLPLPANVTERVTALQPGQGLLAEFIVGDENPRRWLLVSGGDASGLEKAVLTLGSAAALRSVPPNPALIDAMPQVPPEEKGPRLVPAIGRTPLTLHGIYRSERFARGWQLPPGSALRSDGVLNLRLSHSPALRLPGSLLEVLVNGTRLASIPLTPENAILHTSSVVLPRELQAADPTVFTFRAYLDIDPANCDQRKDEQAWVTISQGSTVEATTRPIEITSLNYLNALFLQDPSLRKTTVLVPAGASLDELQLLFGYAMHLGAQVPSASSLWLDAANYRPNASPLVERVQGRGVLLLCSVRQWPSGLPAGVQPAVHYTDGQNESVVMQGRKVRVDYFEPSLVFAQLLASPWSRGDNLVLAGGWSGFATPAMKRLLMDPQSIGKLPGNLAAMDAQGRAAAYDVTKVSSDSFAERVRRQMPLGLSAEETQRRFEAEQARTENSARINRWLFWICGAFVGLLAAWRVLLALAANCSRKPEASPNPTATSA